VSHHTTYSLQLADANGWPTPAAPFLLKEATPAPQEGRSSAVSMDERQAKRVLLAAFSTSIIFPDRDGFNRPNL
jgi:hypothetical protein